jgi:hypothetical protein
MSVPHIETRCDACTLPVWCQFSWCELPCQRAGTWAIGRWHLCYKCGAMRCDAAPVMQKAQCFQPCICDYPNGVRDWMDRQRMDGAMCAEP